MMALAFVLMGCRSGPALAPKTRAWSGSDVPQAMLAEQAVSGPRTVVQASGVELAVASNVACVRTGPEVYCWGANYFDPTSSEQCRRQWNDVDYPCHRVPTRVVFRDEVSAEPAGFTQIEAGFESVCGILESSRAVCWGYGLHGGLGDGTTEMSDSPRLVRDLGGIVDLAVGSAHACALTNDHVVYCWGRNIDGELGDGTQTDRAVPGRVEGLPPVIEVVAGGYHTCAWTSEGELWCWGDNGYGQLGVEGPNDQHAPIRVPGIPPVVEISTDTQEACARTATGEVWCWGGGPAVTPIVNATLQPPTRLEMLRGAAQLSVGHVHGCALMPGGSAQCWGHNLSGNLGDGTIHDRFEPAPIAGVVDVVEIDGRWRSNCVRTRVGEVWCWGDGDLGQIGDGHLESRRAPTRAVMPQGLDLAER